MNKYMKLFNELSDAACEQTRREKLIKMVKDFVFIALARAVGALISEFVMSLLK